MIYKKKPIKILKQLTQRDLALLKKTPILWLKYTFNKVINEKIHFLSDAC